MAELEHVFYKIADIDFTTDYKGCCCKTLIWKYLVSSGFTESQTKLTEDDNDQEQIEQDDDKIINDIINNKVGEYNEEQA